MKKHNKLLLSAALAIATLFAFITPMTADAANVRLESRHEQQDTEVQPLSPFIFDPGRHIVVWFHTRRIPITNNVTVADMQQGIANGIANWNSRTNVVEFNLVHNSVNTINAVQEAGFVYGRLIFGRTGTPVPGPSLFDFRIELNETYIRQMSFGNSARLTNITASVMAHELGHTVGLADNPAASGGGNGSLMNHGRDRNFVTGPTSFDTSSVTMLFAPHLIHGGGYDELTYGEVIR